MNSSDNKIQYQAELFVNRLKRKYKELRKQMRKNRVSCYRLYDRDIPEIPLSLDLYEFLPDGVDTVLEAARFISAQNESLSANAPGLEKEIKERTYAVLYLYERPYEKAEDEEALWLDAMATAAANVLGIDNSHIIKKSRGHKSHKDGEQYTSFSEEESSISGLTIEQGQLFSLNLSSYLDTGLFFDHRPLRATIRDTANKKRLLNLFCYTGSFSVYAAQGNASFVESVDLSNTYLNWAKENMKFNGFTDKNKYIYTRADCMDFLKQKALAAKAKSLKPSDYYDIIILDPPTFSNSKNTYNVLDINRDWPQLVKDCLNILNPGGILYFSTNSEKLKFNSSEIPPVTISGNKISCQDITPQTIPNDYAGAKPHRCWKICVEKAQSL